MGIFFHRRWPLHHKKQTVCTHVNFLLNPPARRISSWQRQLSHRKRVKRVQLWQLSFLGSLRTADSTVLFGGVWGLSSSTTPQPTLRSASRPLYGGAMWSSEPLADSYAEHISWRPFSILSLEIKGAMGNHHKTLSSYLVDPASSHMLVSKIKPCMSKYKHYTVKLRMAH